MLKYFPQSQRRMAEEQFVRLPKSAAEGTQAGGRSQKGRSGRHQSRAGIRQLRVGRVQPAGYWHLSMRSSRKPPKMDLPSATHTGSAADVKDAVDAGTNSIEHGSMVDLIPSEPVPGDEAEGNRLRSDAQRFRSACGFANRQLRAAESFAGAAGRSGRSSDLHTRRVREGEARKTGEDYKPMLDRENQNLINAYKAGVLLITGSDAGNMLVIHGPTVQHELELWVKAGIPPALCVASRDLQCRQSAACRRSHRLYPERPRRHTGSPRRRSASRHLQHGTHCDSSCFVASESIVPISSTKTRTKRILTRRS